MVIMLRVVVFAFVWLGPGWLAGKLMKRLYLKEFGDWENWDERYARLMMLFGPVFLIAVLLYWPVDWLTDADGPCKKVKRSWF